MSTTIAISSSMAAISAVNSAEASRAATDACRSLIAGFDSRAAGTQQMQQYATCVQRVFPEDTAATPAEKFAVGSLLVFILAGVLVVYRMERDPVVSLMGGIFGFMAWAILAGLAFSVAFLLS